MGSRGESRGGLALGARHVDPSCYKVSGDETGWRESYVVSGVQKPETYHESDKERMCATIRAVAKPCLGFKILGAGRQAQSPDDRRAAFEYALSSIKPTDGIVVGMFPKHSNQVAENVRTVAELS